MTLLRGRRLEQLVRKQHWQPLIGSRSNSNSSSVNGSSFLYDKYGSHTFAELNAMSTALSKDLLANYNSRDLRGEKIAVLCANNYSYLVSVLAVWKANGVPLGLNKLYPNNLIEYFLADSKCKLVINGVEPTPTVDQVSHHQRQQQQKLNIQGDLLRRSKIILKFPKIII